MSMTTDQQQHQQQLQQDHSLPLPPSHPLSHSSDRPPATPLSHPSDDMRRASPSDFGMIFNLFLFHYSSDFCFNIFLFLIERSRPPQKEEEKRREEKRVAPADKNTAFQEFKGGVGGEVNQKMKENTELLKEKKKQLKSAGESVNAVKKEIDSLKVSPPLPLHPVLFSLLIFFSFYFLLSSLFLFYTRSLQSRSGVRGCRNQSSRWRERGRETRRRSLTKRSSEPSPACVTPSELTVMPTRRYGNLSLSSLSLPFLSFLSFFHSSFLFILIHKKTAQGSSSGS